MDEHLQDCLDKLAEALSFTRRPVKRIRWARNYYRPSQTDPREYMKEVAEIEYESGAKVYADIGADANHAALYDIMAVIIGKKKPSAMIQRLEFPEDVEDIPLF